MANPTISYEYDRAGRLTRVNRAGSAVAEYDYDPNGNRVAHRYTGGTAAATYGQQDRLLIRTRGWRGHLAGFAR